LLIQGHDIEGKKLKEEDTSLRRFRLLVEHILTESGKDTAFKELPQQMVHFELAARAPLGLDDWAGTAEGRWISALAYTGVDILDKASDDALGIKSGLMWDVPPEKSENAKKEGEEDR
jgi:hypothetical protein